MEEFDCGDIYNQDFTIQQVFEMSVVPAVNAFLQGFSVSVFSFGASGSGKDVTIVGSKKEPGLVLLYSDAIFQ